MTEDLRALIERVRGWENENIVPSPSAVRALCDALEARLPTVSREDHVAVPQSVYEDVYFALLAHDATLAARLRAAAEGTDS